MLYVIKHFFSSFIYRNAYRAEVATFLVPVAGEDASATRLRERIEFSSNILFFIEDLYLALGPGHVTTQAGAKINVVASLLWVRNQHAANLKELMIAKKTGWQVLRNFKNQVIFLRICSFLFYSIQIFPFRDRLFNMRSVQAGVHLALKFSNTGTCLCPVVAFLFSYLHRY